MFILTIIAVFQACFIPGFIIHRGVRPHASIYELLPLSFALSLVVNCLVVMVLVMLGAYTRSVVFSLIAVEISVGAVVLWRMRRAPSPIYIQLPSPLRIIKNWRNTWPGAFASLMIIVTMTYNFQMLGETFSHGDAIYSFNRWALDWFQEKLPGNTWTYPQLLPVSWSLVYKIMGTSDLQFVAKTVSFFILPFIYVTFYRFMEAYGKD